MPARVGAAGISPKKFQGVRLIRRLEHALQGRLGNLGKGCADLRLFRRRHPIVSIVGTPVSLMPRSSASRRSVSSTAAAAWSCRQLQTASGAPSVRSCGGALAHELAARIRQLAQRAELNLLGLNLLGLGRRQTTGQEAATMAAAEIRKNMMALPATFLVQVTN